VGVGGGGYFYGLLILCEGGVSPHPHPHQKTSHSTLDQQTLTPYTHPATTPITTDKETPDMPRNFNTNTDNNGEWLTPPDLIKALGVFDLDPCAPHPYKRPWDTAKTHYHAEGLEQPWTGRVWLNPPYGRETFKWMSRLAAHKKGVALIFARTETLGFHDEVWSKAHAVFFFKRRLKFHKVDGSLASTANAPSCLVTYSEEDTLAIKESELSGKLICL